MITFAELSLEQKIVSVFLLIELVLITVLVLASYGVKVWAVIQKKMNAKKVAAIQEYFKKKDYGSAPPCLNHLGLFFSELDQSTVLTAQEKSDVVDRYVLKQTRPFIRSKHWIKRYYLLESYGYHIEAEDVSNLIKLIQDDVPIISLNAARLSGGLVDAAVYQAIIQKLITFDRATQVLYIAQFEANDVLLEVLKNNIEHTTDTAVKKACYDVVMHIGASHAFYELALKDMNHTHRNCQLVAIRVLAHSDPDKAKNQLFNLLRSNSWLVRNAAVQGLSEINIPESLDELAQCLDDENYWVRVNAAKALLNVGDSGRLLLTEYKASTEASNQDIASYFLDINKIKETL